MRFLGFLLSTFLFCINTSTLAADDGFSGKVSFGYLGTSGNSDTTSINAATNLTWIKARWSHNLKASALGAEDSMQTTAEAYGLSWKSDWAINERSYLFGLARWQKDKFSGYDQQMTESVGYGRKLIIGEVHNWNVEIGAGARQSDLRDGTSDEEVILRGASNYAWQFSETSLFTAGIAVESGADNTEAESALALKARLLNDLALVVSYKVKYNSDVPIGSENTDTFTAISLEYGF